MAKVRAKTLTCPNCNSPVPVRNVLKAKVVVCRSCDSQLDLSTPDFSVLGQISHRQPPQDVICLGLKGELKDGRKVEVIGRIGFSDYDDEESWGWDEWLLLTDNGEYLWLAEENGSYKLHHRVMPEQPPSIAQLESGYSFTVDGVNYAVRERGAPAISYVEGELTWRAQVGDITYFVDAFGDGKPFGVEYNDEEIEFFAVERLSRKEAYLATGLSEIIDLEHERDQKREEYQAGPKSMGCGAFILMGGAALAVLLFLGAAVAGSQVGKGAQATTTEVALAQGIELGRVKLEEGQSYAISFATTVEPATTAATFAIVDPAQRPHPLLVMANLQKRGSAELDVEFVADRAGEHVLTLSGATSSLASTSGNALTATTWSVQSQPFNGSAYLCVAPMLLGIGVFMLMVSAGRRSAASARAAREFRAARATIVERLQHQSQVQEG